MGDSTGSILILIGGIRVNNAAAIGYMILAAKKLGMSAEEIRKLESMMHYCMDVHSEEEAEDTYRKF